MKGGKQLRHRQTSTSCSRPGGRAGGQCTREGVGTGSLGLVTTLVLLLIWKDTVDRRTNREADETGQRWLRVQRFQAAAVREGRSEAGGDWWREETTARRVQAVDVMSDARDIPTSRWRIQWWQCCTLRTWPEDDCHWSQSMSKHLQATAIFGHRVRSWRQLEHHKLTTWAKKSKMMKSTTDKISLYN